MLTNKQTNKQMPLKTFTLLLCAMPEGNNRCQNSCLMTTKKLWKICLQR